MILSIDQHLLKYHFDYAGSAVVEIGAQWVHGDDNIVYGLAAPEGLLHTEFQTQESTGYASNVVAAYTGSGKKITRAQWKLFQDVTEDIYSSSIQDLFDVSNISLGDYFNQKYICISFFETNENYLIVF